MAKNIKSIGSQRGLAGLLISMLLVVFIFFAALAIDVNHALLNKTRLQNGVDAAALAAAVKLDEGASDSEAELTARSTIASMYLASGNTELDILATADSSLISVSFSNDPQDFSGSYDDTLDTFVRVAVADVPLDVFLARFFEVSKTSSASAVAGPGADVNCTCNIVPLAVCVDPDETSASNWGYEYDQIQKLKVGDSDEADLTSGNYQLLDFDDIHIRDALAGGYDGCICVDDESPPPITESKPGNTIGPTAQGLNTRFGEYKAGLSADEYPSDTYLAEALIDESFDESGATVFSYASDNEVTFDSYSGNSRRILNVPMIDCTEAKNGKTDLPIVGIRCFLMLQKAPSSNADKGSILGAFGKDCVIQNGTTGPNPSGDGPYKIILYKDPLSGES
ncbi:Tad domain-containing protein [Vibrio sp. SCSIO 43140]|uniref:TadE/TadG family type IV pilus assembly protein n=1 Tax=Vibrio sp. SCSIO 43140 TaxID=2819100 RepID=UPI0020759BD6|nr:Tad domain-containing protein [Vibrio sp. SCSIO 43140]USD61774.1 Tad domain-containing protein [Vibrio sp. SCSIO 43140]